MDLGDQTGRAIKVTSTGWTVEPEAPVLFKRTALTAALPEPIAGGDLKYLWELLNAAEPDRPLVLAWLLAFSTPICRIPSSTSRENKVRGNRQGSE